MPRRHLLRNGKSVSYVSNASKSTGPKTPQGKSWSCLNALKHAILASQAVIATIEGHAERKLFEASVEGLAQDFQPGRRLRTAPGAGDRGMLLAQAQIADV